MNEKNRPGTAVGTETINSVDTQSTTSDRRAVRKPPINQLIHDEVLLFFDTRGQSTCSPEDVEMELLNRINERLVSESVEYGLKGKNAYQQLKALPPAVIAECILTRELKHTGLIGKSRATAELMTYEDKYEEPNKGLYVPAEDRIRSLAFQYNYMLSPKECDDVVKRVRYLAPLLKESEDRDVVALANGLFDLRSKKLRDFSPDVVLTSKASVAFNPDATTCPVMDDGWNVDEWIRELANNDPEVEKLFWQIIAALFRPGHSFDKAVLLYSPTGSNGKGTFLELLRNLVGVERVATLSMSDFSKPFLPPSLLNCFAVLSDENRVGAFMRDTSKLKAWVTHDWVPIDVKYGPMVETKGRGLCVFCVNELPSSKDKSESLYRRFIPIPFLKRYVGADENKAIKDDYVKRREVLEYVVYKVLMTDLFGEFIMSAKCEELLGQIRVENDPVLQFAEEFLPQFVWDFLPWDFVYGVYSAWMHKEVPSGRPVSSREFNKRLSAYVDEHPSCGWFVPRDADGKQTPVRTGKYIIAVEPLAAKYGIGCYRSNVERVDFSVREFGTPYRIPISARGLLRVGTSSTDDEEPDHESPVQELESVTPPEQTSSWQI